MSALCRIGVIASALALVPGAPARAIPDLRQGRVVGGVRVFEDDRLPNVFYYAPWDLTLVTDQEGRPDFQLLEMRYTGTDIEGDTATRRFRNILTMRLALSGPTAADLRVAKEVLGAFAELRPLPINRLEAAVIYAPAGSGSPRDSVTALPAGQFEAEGSPGLTSANAYWTERVFAVRLDNATAALFDAALRRGLLVLSVGYAFFGAGIGSDQPLTELSGSPELVDALKKMLGADSAQVDKSLAGHLVEAGALAIHVDLARWPDLVRQIDINSQLPPGYPLLAVRCYDFSDSVTAAALSAKMIEFRATGVAGHPVATSVLFSASQPELYAQTVRFQYAVQLSRPFRYRVIEVTRDGVERATPWAERTSWSGMLDVSGSVASSERAAAHSVVTPR